MTKLKAALSVELTCYVPVLFPKYENPTFNGESTKTRWPIKFQGKDLSDSLPALIWIGPI